MADAADTYGRRGRHRGSHNGSRQRRSGRHSGSHHAPTHHYRRALDIPRSHGCHWQPPAATLPSPQILGLYDPRAAAAWIRDLRQQGLSYTLIAVQLTREGIPTRYGKPWEHSSVRYVYETYGRHEDTP